MKTIYAKKSLGQHFLNSPSVLAKIIDASNILPNETVLEIGPGTGILTKKLIEGGAHVIAIEKDNRAYAFLKEIMVREIEEGKLNLILGDILEFDTKTLKSLRATEGNYAIVANIPYYITGAILRKFLENSPRPNRMILLVQKEVATRMVARDKKESLLSISVKAFGTPRIVDIVPKGAFVPPPNVDSAIIAIENISDAHFCEKPKDVAISSFFAVLHAGFAHKRKILIRNLEDVAKNDPTSTLDKNKITEIWKSLGLDEKIRAEDLSIDQWLNIIAQIAA